MISPSTTSSLEVERCGPSGASSLLPLGRLGHREVRVAHGRGDETPGDDRGEQVARDRPHEGQHEDEADDVRHEDPCPIIGRKTTRAATQEFQPLPFEPVGSL